LRSLNHLTIPLAIGGPPWFEIFTVPNFRLPTVTNGSYRQNETEPYINIRRYQYVRSIMDRRLCRFSAAQTVHNSVLKLRSKYLGIKLTFRFDYKYIYCPTG